MCMLCELQERNQENKRFNVWKMNDIWIYSILVQFDEVNRGKRLHNGYKLFLNWNELVFRFALLIYHYFFFFEILRIDERNLKA